MIKMFLIGLAALSILGAGFLGFVLAEDGEISVPGFMARGSGCENGNDGPGGSNYCLRAGNQDCTGSQECDQSGYEDCPNYGDGNNGDCPNTGNSGCGDGGC